MRNFICYSRRDRGTSSSLTLSTSNPSVVVGNSVTFTVSPYNFVNPSYTLSDNFSGTTILNSDINSNGIFNWVPTVSDIGTHTITIYASDSSGHSANTVEQITVSQSSSSTQPVFSQTVFLWHRVKATKISISGNGNYYVSNNSNPSVATALINGSIATISALPSSATLPPRLRYRLR